MQEQASLLHSVLKASRAAWGEIQTHCSANRSWGTSGAPHFGLQLLGRGVRQVPSEGNLPFLSTNAPKAAGLSLVGREALIGMQYPDFSGRMIWPSLMHLGKALLAW